MLDLKSYIFSAPLINGENVKSEVKKRNKKGAGDVFKERSR
jgi:hypothetical protein